MGRATNRLLDDDGSVALLLATSSWMTNVRRRLRSLVRPAGGRAEDLLTGPIHGELLGAEHLADRAREIARGQDVAPPRPFDPRARLLARLDSTRAILDDGYTRLASPTLGGDYRDPSADWLLDNYHVLQDHMQEVRDALPRTFYRELPELASGPLRGYPRIYEIAIVLISHSEGRIVLDTVDHFVEAFQEVTPLTVGELWAMPAMLRIGLIENLRRMTLRTLHRLDELIAADHWAERVQALASRDDATLGRVLAEMVAEPGHTAPGFLTRLLARLRDAGDASPAVSWLEHWMTGEGLPADAAATQATQRLAHTQIMTANSITSLRTIGRRDWRTFVERQSVLDAVLRRDPAGDYTRMTFATRDRYRHVVERLAKRSRRSETEVAEVALRLAHEAGASHPDPERAARQGHVGYFLIGRGLGELERQVGAVPPLHERLWRVMRRHPDVVLVGGLVVLTVGALLAVTLLAGGDVARIAWPGILLFALLPAWDIGITAVNQILTALLPPRVLPALDFTERGIPTDCRTAVVVPTLFGSAEDVQAALDDLEVLFLANRDDHLVFAVLSDYLDAAEANQPGDAAIREAAVAGIDRLNARYADQQAGPFRLLHRARQWNPQEGVWMGWERKRGKLADFFHALRGAERHPFEFVAGGTRDLDGVRYVITLDADTVLPLDAARELVGIMAHPLNRPIHDAAAGRVVAGYGILQPRVGISLTSAQRSTFAAIHSGLPGVDPYTTAVSDLYQDLYGEGSFTGKGIIDVDAFLGATRGRFPANTLLSHDLIEGNYARAGLATGVVLYDDYPTSYLAHARRKHRWIRGDWQLLPWLAPRVPGPEGREPNRLPLVSRWKIVDNLRRSTVEVSQLILILAGWLILAGPSLRWTLLGFGAIAAPWCLSLLIAAVRPPADRSWRAYYLSVARDARTAAQQFALAVVVLPHQAWLSVDAIVRTLWRLAVSRRHLLEWQTSARVSRATSGQPIEAWRAMRPSLLAVGLLAVVATALAVTAHDPTLPTGSSLTMHLLAIWPLTLLWLAGPMIVTRLGRARAPQPLDPATHLALRRYAERHWQYFVQYATAETHWLAPDNVQADPVEEVARRTSPTNIGLQLLATVSAVDLELSDLGAMTDTLERIVGTLDRLPRYRGHFYNWYALDDLRVLEPAYVSTVDSGNLAGHLLAVGQACREFAATPAGAASELAPRLTALADRLGRLVGEMEFDFLYDATNQLFVIGYHPDSHTLDASYYDLLASEARLACFVAVAKGDVPVEAWFRMGRTLIRRHTEPMLVSWSGSMFEYLMPLLVMKSFPGTLLDQSDRGAVRTQIAYGRTRRVPWGVSECAYNVRDAALTYQYRGFGVPDLALRRGLGRDVVVAPYATALAAMIAPHDALGNLTRLEYDFGALGPHGFWDALDFTRTPPSRDWAVVKTVMAHHAGMTLVALTNVLTGGRWPARFHRVAAVRATELLLQERVPRSLVVQELPRAAGRDATATAAPEPVVTRTVHSPDTPQPRVALLGDLPYTVMVTHAGGGFSRYRGLDVTRWRADGTSDDTGQFIYLRDLDTRRLWSAGHQPTGARADEYHAHLAPDRITLHRIDGPIETRTEIAVVQPDAAEVRRVTVTNHGPTAREIELTSYAEVVLGPPGADRAHPAFANLFVETEWHAWCTAITARRRPRASGEPAPWCVHLVDGGSHRVGEVSCDTDRSVFIGRGRSVRNPAALDRDGALAGTTGAVLDPIVALRTRVRVPPGEAVTVAFTTLVADTRERAFELADRYRDPHAAQRALDLAWMATQIDLREWKVTSGQVAVFQDMAGLLLFGPNPTAESRAAVSRSAGSQPQLWAQGISGDQPILLATIADAKGLSTVGELFAAHRYWRQHGIAVDLVIVVSHPHDYLQELRQSIQELMLASSDASMADRPGGVFVRRRDGIDPDDYAMLRATARVEVACDGRPLSRVLPRVSVRRGGAAVDPLLPHYIERRVRERPAEPIDASPPPPLPGSTNGLGAVTPVGDYQIRISRTHLPPAPWCNVIANAAGGFIVSERGAGCTWATNAYFYRLTPWHNDPVGDAPGDVIYLHDEDSGATWSVTPGPTPDAAPYDVTHAPGRTSFGHVHGTIESTLEVGVPPDEAVKLSLVTLQNHGSERCRLTLTSYAEWTLGVHREASAPHVRTEYADDAGAILARNRFDPAFADQVAFHAVSEPVASYTADRREFLGRHGTLNDPAGLRRERLAGTTGAGLDPCAALRVIIHLNPGESRRVAVLLGAASGDAAARAAIQRYRAPEAVAAALADSSAAWQRRLDVIQVATPNPALDLLLNRWLLYQALACRLWARAALYQSSGAYGFRDQLQDVMALLHAEPALARGQIVRAAARQFVEGDVQHWWHPQSGRGVRTRFSDDLVWLPYVVDQYLRVTGDRTVLEEQVPFLSTPPLAEGEQERYDLPRVTDETASVYDHCVRALRRACTHGAHDLPLIGSGDWNDGFSRVGVGGKGESVWLAWFLGDTLARFIPRVSDRGDTATAADLTAHAERYRRAVDQGGWDGAWYRRAYFDDGTPLGSATGEACKIDSIAQSWSVIAATGDPARRAAALRAVEDHLVHNDSKLIALLTPPFGDGPLDPGYIRGYLPGVRENGAQYTHAALWVVQATALLGDGDRAMELYDMINPFHHADTAEAVARYKVEPYVVAADVYTAAGHEGRGGWTWYTGSAGWMYRIGLEVLLGFTRRGDRLRIRPTVPAVWPEFTLRYQYGGSRYRITVRRPAEVAARGGRVVLDDHPLPDDELPLVDDGQPHDVLVEPVS
jgi:cyclic beta-1,2-glucan synthetase